jgi:hypothetical protein
MTIQVFEGQKHEILEKIAKLSGQMTRAILWVEDGTPSGKRAECECDPGGP